MTEEMDPKEIVEKYMRQMVGLAREAGLMLDRTVDLMEASSREMVRTVSQETQANAQEMKRLAAEVMGDVRQDIPKVRAELKDMEARARQRLREFGGT